MKQEFSVRQITCGPKYHFKSYYGMQPWDKSGQYFLCMESDFQDRPPKAGDSLAIGMVDLANNEFIPLTETKAWNFQQGCMLHWLEDEQGKTIIYNDRIDNKFHAILFNVETKEKKILPLPVQALSPDKKTAACLNFARWGVWRPGYGYAGVADPFAGQNKPEDDAVYLMDITSGAYKPAVNLAQIAHLTSDLDRRKDAPMWFNHLMFNTDGTRLVGLVRWWCPEAVDDVKKTTINIDGAVAERRHCLWMLNIGEDHPEIIVNDGLVSHAEWRDPDHILAWASSNLDEPHGYRVFNVMDKTNEVIGEDLLTEDGHMSYHKNKNLLLTDTYPDADYLRTLKIHNISANSDMAIGRFFAPPDLQGELRCDLHPCWNRDYTRVAIDSIHNKGQRQVYIVDVGEYHG